MHPLAEKPAKPCREHLVIHGGGGGLAIRRGPWKLIPGQGAQAKAELYNLADDLGETKDLAAKMPDRVKELSELLKQVREKGRSR